MERDDYITIIFIKGRFKNFSVLLLVTMTRIKQQIVGLFVQNEHYEHEDASDEIHRLTLLQQCQKRAAEDEPLRHIFDNVCRSSADIAKQASFCRDKKLNVQAASHGNAYFAHRCARD